MSTVWDYVHRAMPFGAAQTLSDDEVYAVVAYLLYLNDLVDDDFVLNQDNLAETHLPNEEGFYLDDRPEVELPRFTRDVCMSDCKDNVEITMHAAVLDVTPEGGGASLEDATPTDEATADVSESEMDTAAAIADDGDSNLAEAAGDIDIGLNAVEGDGAVEAERSDTNEGSLAMAEANPELISEGETLFRQCKSCHQIGEGAKNRVGPKLNGVIGRAAGAVDDFRYSKAMQEAGEAGLVWDAVSLEEFLSDPRGYLKGTKMTFNGLDQDEIPAMLAYLGSFDGE